MSATDTGISEALQSLFASPFPTTTFQLSFTYNGKLYSTVLEAEYTAEQLSVANGCMRISFVPERISRELNPFKGKISANSPEKACFTPMLTSDSRSIVASSRVNSVDVLQTLKTKVGMLFPMIKTHRLCITDVAEKEGVDLSSFRILRGEDAVYEKYGYQSEFMDDLKRVVRGLTWGQEFCVKELQLHINSMLTFVNNEKGSISLLTGADIPSSTLIIDIMRSIGFEYEVAYAKKYMLCFSYHLLLIIGNKRIEILNAAGRPPLPADYMYATKIGKPNAWVFCLNPESDAWRRSKDALLFTNLTVGTNSASAASSRKTRRQSRRRRRRQRRSRRQSQRH